MREKIYEIDGAIFNLTTTVIGVGKKEIRLVDEKNQPYQKTCGFIVTNQTIFHPQGGGQPADRGSMGGADILHVGLEKTTELECVMHYYDSEKFQNIKKYKEGDCIEMRVDPEFRFQCARYHSAGHLLADIVEAIYPVTSVKGNHFPGQASVTFSFSNPDDLLFESLRTDVKTKEDLIKNIQKSFDRRVMQATPVSTFFDDSAGRTRKIGIGERSMPCGGTHVDNTAKLFDTMIDGISIEKKPPGFKIKYSCQAALS